MCDDEMRGVWHEIAMDNHQKKDLPAIPGVPAEHIPYLVQALRSCSKFYQKCTQKTHTVYDHERCHDSSTGTCRTGGSASTGVDTSSDFHDAVMERVAAAVSRQGDDSRPSLDSILAERQRNMEMSISRWLESLKRYVPRHQTKAATIEEVSALIPVTSSSVPDDKQHSVPFSLFLYLWEMTATHERVTVRRSALLLCGILLQKSRDCRFHLGQDTVLIEWIGHIVARRTKWKNPESAMSQLPLLHREAYYMLSHLIDDGYATRYPKIGVAAARLRQQCPNLTGSGDELNTHVASMSEYRRLRDVALMFGEKEISVLRTLLNRSNRYLEILVPRFTTPVITDKSSTNKADERDGHNNGIPENYNKNSMTNECVDNNSDDDDDSGNIDWEDGDDFDDGLNQNNRNKLHAYIQGLQDHILHVSAVDRTIATMQSALHNKHELDIDFGGKKDEEDDNKIHRKDEGGGELDDEAQRKMRTRQKLQICVQKLSSVHLPRLTAWLDGLRNSDNLIVEPESGSLVLLSSTKSVTKAYHIDVYSRLKQEIARILAAASRLRIVNSSNTNQISTNPSATATTSTDGEAYGERDETIRLSLGSRDRGSYDVNVRIKKVIGNQRIKRKRTATRSKGIQIKCIRR